MSSRRQAREWALQMIFELDANPNAERPLESVFDEFWNGQLRLRDPGDPGGPPDAHAKGFAEALVRGTLWNRRKLIETLRLYGTAGPVKSHAAKPRPLYFQAVLDFPSAAMGQQTC